MSVLFLDSVPKPSSFLRVDFARNDYNGAPITDLLEIIEYVKPTALLGLSTITVSVSVPLRSIQP